LADVVTLVLDGEQPVAASGNHQDARARGLTLKWEIDSEGRIMDPGDAAEAVVQIDLGQILLRLRTGRAVRPERHHGRSLRRG
jgi:hypothetical protein